MCLTEQPVVGGRTLSLFTHHLATCTCIRILSTLHLSLIPSQPHFFFVSSITPPSLLPPSSPSLSPSLPSLSFLPPSLPPSLLQLVSTWCPTCRQAGEVQVVPTWERPLAQLVDPLTDQQGQREVYTTHLLSCTIGRQWRVCVCVCVC